MSRHPKPKLYTVPPGAQTPVIPGSPVESWSPYLQTDHPNGQVFRPYGTTSTSGLVVPDRLHGRSISAHALAPPPVAFPEPQLSRSSSYGSSFVRGHRPSRSDSGHQGDSIERRESLEYLIDVRDLPLLLDS